VDAYWGHFSAKSSETSTNGLDRSESGGRWGLRPHIRGIPVSRQLIEFEKTGAGGHSKKLEASPALYRAGNRIRVESRKTL
jgi:hypothetical protein